jgi:hypothetical protein
MRNSDKPKFAIEMAKLCAAFGKELQTATTEVYFEALEDLDARRVLPAMAELRKTSEFFPRPVHIRRLVQPDQTKAKALMAWERFAGVGRHKEHPPDPLGDRAGELMGPMKLVSDWEGPWAQKRFLEIYETLVDSARAARRAGAPQLTSGGRKLLGGSDG